MTIKSASLTQLMVQSGIPPSLTPTVITALRAFGLGWSLTTIPGVLGTLIKALLATRKNPSFAPWRKALLEQLPRVLKNSVTTNGVPYLFAGAFAGHGLLSFVLRYHAKRKQGVHHKSQQMPVQEKSKISFQARVFLSAAATMFAVHRLFPRTKSIDFTLFAFVRALDVFAHRAYDSPTIRRTVPGWVFEYGSVIAFMLVCTEIMFAWFFAPSRLPGSYASWITKVSEMDERLLLALRAIREGKWVYGKDTGLGNLLGDYAVELGLPKELGDPVRGRIPCLLVHSGVPGGCEVHGVYRFGKGFLVSFPLYFTVHLLPYILFRRSQLMSDPVGNGRKVLSGAVRSSAFLGTFIALVWYSICLVRTRIGHQLLGVNQTRLDDTLGPLVGCAMCGLSLVIENKRRRGEMAMYVGTRAIYSLMERVLGPYQRGRPWEGAVAEAAEILVFASSVAVVVQAMFHDREMIRPSIRGLLSWIYKGEIKKDEASASNGSIPSQETNGKPKALEL